jgi:broad specificity phosphatase PhoE
MRVLRAIQAERPSGRVAACTHGDVLPALVGYLFGAYGLDLPAYNATRGGWYTIRIDASSVSVEHHDVLAGFPL